MSKRNLKFPHLLPADVPVWERFLKAFPDRYDFIDYDVRVGRGRPAPAGSDPAIQKDARDLSRRRIDAIGFTAGQIDIIEITRLVDLKAIGQLIAYPVLYQTTFRPSIPVRTIIVAEEFHTDIAEVIATLPVTVWLSPDPEGREIIT